MLVGACVSAGNVMFKSKQNQSTGCLFHRGETYFNTRSNEYSLCLGFMAYGCLSVPMKRIEDRGNMSSKNFCFVGNTDSFV